MRGEEDGILKDEIVIKFYSFCIIYGRQLIEIIDNDPLTQNVPAKIREGIFSGDSWK